MPATLLKYRVEMTKIYPPDVRVFISRLVPILVKHYGYPRHFDKKTALRCFEWGYMYNRVEAHCFGEKGAPRVECERKVIGDLQFSDEYERTSMLLVGFQPPYIADTLALRVDCAESFLMTDKGDHQCVIDLQTDAPIVYAELRAAIERIARKFKNAHLHISE